MLGITDLKGHKQTHSLQRIEALVYVIAQKDVLIALHLVVVGKTKVLKQSYQIEVSSINATKNLHWRPYHSNRSTI